MAPRSPPVPASSPRVSFEIAQEAGERFEEAATHLHGLPEFAALRVDPSGPVPLGRLSPGTIAWTLPLSWPRRGGSTTARGSADVYYVLQPAGVGRASPFSDEATGPIRLRLAPVGGVGTSLLVISRGAVPARLEAFVRRLARALRTDDP